jgi:hypothetical protein
VSQPNADTIGPRFVARELVKAEELLANAQKATGDRTVADQIGRTRRELAPALARARAILKDADLRTALQTSLLDPTQEG